MFPIAEKSIVASNAAKAAHDAEKATLEFAIRRQLAMYVMTPAMDGETRNITIPMMTERLMRFAQRFCADIECWMFQTGMFDVVSGCGVLMYKYTTGKKIHETVQMIARQSYYSCQGEYAVEHRKLEPQVIDTELSQKKYEQWYRVIRSVRDIKPAIQPAPSVIIDLNEPPFSQTTQEESPFDTPDYKPAMSEPPRIPEDESPSEFGLLMNMGLPEHLLPKKG
jgi:hypothetical protein